MNEQYEIYQDFEKDIPKEDRARLDGYLKGRSDQALLHKNLLEKLIYEREKDGK